MKLKDVYYALRDYSAHILFGEFRHAAKCLSDFRRCAATASIGELGTLTIGGYDRLRTLLTDARRDFAEIGDLPSEMAARRERHDAELRRLMDATARDAETAGQAATKAGEIEAALERLLNAVKLEMDFINHSAARLSVARTAKRIDGEYQADWNAWGYLSRYAENLPTGAELARRCLTLRGICAEHDTDAAHDAAFHECLSNWKANGTADFKFLIPLLRKADGGKGRGELAHDVQGYQAALDAAIRDAADAAKRGDWDAFQDAVNAYCREATTDHALLALEVSDWERELNARLASAWEAADAAAKIGTAATAAADAPMVANPAPSASVGSTAAATGAAATATPSVTFEQEAQGVTKRVIVNGMTDAARAQAQAVQAFANWNAPQGGAQVAPQIATTRKRGYQGLGIPTDDAAKEVIKAAMIHKRDNPDMTNPDVIQWLLIKGSKNVKLRILQDRNHTAIDPNSELGKDLYSYYGYDRKKQTGKTPLKMGGMVFDIGKSCKNWGSYMSAVKRSKEKNALVQTGGSEPKLTYSPLKSISNHKRHKRT